MNKEMGHRSPLLLLLLLLPSAVFSVLMIAAAAGTGISAAAGPSRCGSGGTVAVLFVFGDSNSDTGGLEAAMGLNAGLPSGRAFFHRPTGRFSDGRLILDFLCDSLNTSYLTPYLDSLGSGFRNGANFAVGGSATLPKYKLFSLHVQVLQFLHFKSRSLQPVVRGSIGLISEEGFRKALYLIDIGQNDLSDSFALGLSYDQVIGKIPYFVSEIKEAIETLYDNGGRNFWVHGTGPLGCLPQRLTLRRAAKGDLDTNGCVVSYNSAAKEFNLRLSDLCAEMGSELKDATVVYTDVYSIKYDLIANHTRYGFKSPLLSCCGYGGPPYNYNINITCGNPGSQACQNGLQYVSWDGVHYTDAANAIAAAKLLSSDYSRPKLKFDYFCHH
ncbi:GDSL esterase/lipase-like [Iris pallida]|uniref:GDSL esterase/lipase-like n=1 Tax=Iris pallida TaxID=29817 RepID=A0AAX6I5N6_IRIPA|nr:GDSL esterase/lipase-like [Iris pallida]